MNIFIVDDHPMTVAGYAETLSGSQIFPQSTCFIKAYNCQDAFSKITANATLDLAIIDFGLPSFAEQNIFSGSDLTKIVKQHNPECKVIIITAHTEILIIFEIYKNTKPDGLIIKNDLTPENLKTAASQVMIGNQFQSTSVQKVIQDIWKKELMIEDTNREILLYLSKGNKIKDIERITKISMSTIQRRIAHMKDAFNVSEDSSLIKEAILQGFL
ncbi:DNA-binding response regulator [Flavobacterium tegetincola]|uniref:DNA-binding response regulator n=1 Tax=Flavobacterium tegetincola TaxID=150172 RepID=UPI00041F31A5|nr:response regulator [Flavobacterium tegetincola]